MTNKIISPIAIDMGAKNTGVYLNHFEQGEDPTTSGNIQGKTIVIDGQKITWSQVSRTQKRHQIRTQKRRKLSKRLLILVLNEYGVTADQKQWEYLMGLLNRRGYNRIEITEEQEATLQISAVSDFFYPHIFNSAGGDRKLLQDLENKVVIKDKESKEKWQSILDGDIFSLSGKQNVEFKAYLKDINTEKEIIADLSKGFTAIKNLIQKQIDNYDTGHLHRKDYLKNIENDVKNEVLTPLLSGALTAEKLACLIGNISNLQLRILRKYFNKPEMKSGDKWVPDRLCGLFFKWARNWHCKLDNEKQNRQKLLALKDNQILDVLTTSNPELSIPPYEDQNNRRPPKDLTLRLKPKGLDKYLQGWGKIVELLIQQYALPQLDNRVIESIDIKEGLIENVRLQKNSKESKERQILADTLHRIFDRTTILDPYKLRWLCQGSETPEAKNAKELLNKHSNNQAEKITALAKHYYAEMDAAKQGLWSDNENSLFFRCETNPPHKNKIQHNLISHILGENLDDKGLNKFINECWNNEYIKIGPSKVVNVAKNTEEERKKYGNRFKYLVQRQVWLNDQDGRELDTEKKHGADGKSILKIQQNSLKISDEIAKHFDHTNQQKKVYANVFSIAQLYNILETQIKGFSKTDRWNTIENSWRSRKDNFDEQSEPIANAVRLTADSIRPFDGLLDRIISRQAYEIATFKIQQIEALNIDKNDELFVPIFMEQNRFKFEQDMHDIKGAKNVKKKTRDNAVKGLENQEIQWQDKDNRIKSNTLCPYTGSEIGNGEIDHIIPQSKSKHHGDVVFNSEANLIYCSGDGNHTKSDHRYDFNKLNSAYLTKIFNGKSRETIQEEIKNYVSKLDENNTVFHNLDEQGQKYLRHALFMSELDGKTFPILNTRYRTFVNGTQGYLGKQIRKLLQDKYPNVEVKTYQIGAAETRQLRDILGAFDDDFAKQNRQGAFSHVIDAAMVLASALQNQKVEKELKTTSKLNTSKNEKWTSDKSEHGQWLKSLLPATADIQHIERKPKYRKDLSSTQIFKDGIYGERFMTILLDSEKICYGFSVDNCHEIMPLKAPKKGIKDFEKKLQAKKDARLKAQNAYFELLEPFLFTGSSRKNNKQSVTGSLANNQQKYSYLAVDRVKAITHLQKCAKEVCGDVEIKQAETLEKLRYSVEKKKVKDILLTGEGKKTFIKQLDDEKFKVSGLNLPAKQDWLRLLKHPIKIYNGKTITLNDCFGKDEQIEINNPKMKNFWRQLAKESGLTVGYLKDRLLKKTKKNGDPIAGAYFIPKTGKKNDSFNELCKANPDLEVLNNCKVFNDLFGENFTDTKDLIPQKSWDDLFEQYFHSNKVKNTNKHKQVRKEYSLPIVSNPSGGFRIKRKNPLTNEDVYQVSAIADGGYACGFAKGEDGAIDMSEKGVTFNSELKSSRNVAYIGKKKIANIKQEQDSDLVESFGNKRKVELNCEKISDSYLTLAESSRIDITMTIKNQTFKALCQFSDIDATQPPPSLSFTFNKQKEVEEHRKFKDFFTDSKIPMPRDSGNILRWSYKFSVKVAENDIELAYRTSLDAKMKTAYKNGTPIK